MTEEKGFANMQIKGVLVAFKGEKQGFQSGFNNILKTTQTYPFDGRDN